MTTKKCIIVKLSALIFAFNSDVALAVESESSSIFFPGWPLVALLLGLIVFRKKIFAEATVQIPKTEQQETPAPVKEAAPATAKPKAATKTKAAAKPKPAAKAKTTATKAKTTASVKLAADGEQCQASTAKGTRCKRTTTLENASVTIDGKKHPLTVCKQHNNDEIKPFSELI